jgi:hypothetical protein
MKRLIIAALSTVAIAGIATPGLAGEVAATNNTSIRNVVELTPFNLVTHGYQGYFSSQGIPSNARYVTAIRTGKVDAERLVKAAIASGRLAPEKFNDRVYLNHVEWQLSNLDKN